jgi:DNA-binding NarL/FixJ family response regulator
MDQVDRELLAAWRRVLERMGADPEERARRRARAARIRQRPARAWCVAVRAGDTRIDEWGLSWSVDDDAQHWRAHTVEVTQWDLADLTAPISLGPWPGVPISEAAKLLGRRRASILGWAKTGALRMEYYDRRVFGYGFNFGGPMAVVWSPSPIDPNSDTGRPPHQVWGTLWQHLAEQVPADWTCALQRVPAPVPGLRGGRLWRWVCPGRGAGAAGGEERGEKREEGASGAELGGGEKGGLVGGVGPVALTPALSRGAREREGGCGRLVDKLYLPLPCWTIADLHGEAEELGIPAPAWADLRGQPMACRHCWNIENRRLTNSVGWNLFVSHMTGGLLTGREVRRPEHDAPVEEKRCTYVGRWQGRTAGRRERVRAMLLAGAPYEEIAAALGAPRTTVKTDAQAIYRAAGIAPRQGRWALARKLGLSGQEAELARRLARGWSVRAIWEELGITEAAAWARVHRLYRRLGIGSRAELRALVGVGGTVAAAATAAEPEIRVAS